MAEKETGGSTRHGVGGWRVWAAVALSAGAVLILGGWLSYGTWHHASAWEQLVAINRAHFVDPNTNAATVYQRLAADPNWWLGAFNLLVAYRNVTSGSSGRDTDAVVMPDQIAGPIIAIVQEASDYERCYFSLMMEHRRRQDLAARILQAAEIAACAARLDLPAGRTREAQAKWQAVMRMAQHLRQQPLMSDLLVALKIEMAVWHAAADFIVQDDATEEQLRMIEALVPALRDNWHKEAALALQVERLFAQMSNEETTLYERLADSWRGTSSPPVYDQGRTRDCYLRLLADRRGTRLLIALRRYRNATGAWPRRLDDIRRNVPKNAWSDPFHHGAPFQYRAAGDNFLLYSRGPDGRDQGGQGDDRRIWPQSGILAEQAQEKTP